MTTAHKPTWNPAMGAEERVTLRGPTSQQISSRDLPGYTKLNYRKKGQNAPEEVHRRNFREELEEREKKHKEKRHKDEDNDGEDDQERSKRRKIEAPPSKDQITEFNPLDKDDSESDDSSSEEEEGSDNETTELRRELERITKEREEEQKRQKQDKEKEEAENKAQGVLKGNPLLNPEKEDFNIKKKWYEDVVFKNQTRGAPEKKKQRFINDTIRNDFHRKFLNKYVK